MARCIRTIVKVLLNVTPVSQTQIRHELNSIQDSLAFAPPEFEQLQWQRLLEAYTPCCSPPQEEWQLVVCAILSDVSIDSIRAEVTSFNQTQAESGD